MSRIVQFWIEALLVRKSFHYRKHIINTFHLFVKSLKLRNVHLNMLNSPLIFCYSRRVPCLQGSYRISFNWIKVDELFGNVEWSDDTIFPKNQYLQISTKNQPNWDYSCIDSLNYFFCKCFEASKSFFLLICQN